ncbi:MAG TPA: pitrilysin family protein, partial [Usitatibacteraceae bacterium]|nr:pitrilysin family protein [Usitatibacteraceae bacterium]
FAAAPALAQALPKGVEKVTSVEGITEYRLDNGLKVLLFPDLSKPTLTVNITYLVGSRHENYGETGMAHLLEHLVFKGTPKNPDLDKQFNQRGARSNGTTWLDRTNYYELLQATDDNLKWAIEMEADRMVNSFIRKSDLDTEFTVVRNEYEMGENSPFSVLLKRMQSVAFDWHAYGRSTIGNKSDIENVKEANLQAFYRTYYQPDNAVLLVAGKFDEAKALAIVADAFGKIPKPARKLPELWTVEPTQDGERQFMIRRKGDVQIVAVAYKVPSGLHPDSDGISFANFILADTPTGRLHKALVETGKAAQVFGFPLTGVNPGLHLFGATVKKGDPVEPVKEELVRILEGFGAAPPTAEEIARARKSYENQYEKALANHESVGVQLSEYIALGDWRLFFLARDLLPKITPEMVAKAAAAYYRRDNRTVGIYVPEDAPQRAEIPPAPTVAEVMKDFKGKAQVAAAEAFDPSQANIDARTKRLEFGGLKVALLAKKNRGETVNVTINLHMGDEKSLFGQKTVAGLAGQMLSRGTTKLTRTQLSDELERLKVSGRVGGTGGSFQTTRPNLEEALKLAAHVLKEPAFPESEFEQLRNQTITSIQAQLAEPNARASEALSRHFNAYPKGDWRYAPTLEESIEAVKAAKLDDVKRFHREFYGAGVAEIAIVGDFDEARVAALVQELFAGWKAQKPWARVPVQHGNVAAANLSIATPDKENAILLARQNLDLRDDDPDYPALFVADYILGGGAGLDSRLAMRLRQKDGLSYAAGSGLNVPAVDRSASWSVYAIAAPANIAKAEAAMKEELARALAEGFTEAELAAAKSGTLQTRLQTRAQDGALAGGWAFYLHHGRTFAFSRAFEDRLQALTLADVNAAVRKHLDPARLTIVKAGDFK